jgi:hypothetical protein
MAPKHTVSELIEDHALERVPEGDRHNWLRISATSLIARASPLR